MEPIPKNGVQFFRTGGIKKKKNYIIINMTKTENEEIIHLKVKSNDHEEIFFKIKKVTPLKKLMEKYCERMGLSNLNNVRFLFDGERIVPSNTPAQLNMQNGDEIDVYVEQHGGTHLVRTNLAISKGSFQFFQVKPQFLESGSNFRY